MDDLLSQIDSPQDLKKLSVNQLKPLADEIRRLILDSVSKTGGHLASNLGAVEATIALHYVFDFSKDKLLFDVGHQCYAHKILTGRKKLFPRLRQADGISGFPNPDESPYDQFAVGHAGTAVATAIGMAIGQTQTKKSDKIVVFVGDASIVNGTSFEALNNLGLVRRQLLIVLNDNSMAIDTTQGSLAKYFSKVRLSQTYEDMRDRTNKILEHLPLIGKTVEDAIAKIKKHIRMVMPTSQLFETLHIPYFGPVDGHDIGSLVQLFQALAHLNHPAILHIYTKKGMGFVPAENDRPRFHSTGPFKINGDDVEDGVVSSRPTFTKTFGQCLVELASKNDKVIAITSAMCDGTGLVEFREKFPDRFYDVGIAESAAVDIAAGLAKTGARPVVCIYSTFLQRSFDQIFQEVALQNLPVVFCIDRAGVVGSDGPTHHGLMDIGYMRMMPNMVLTAPANEIEVKLALEFALTQNQPVCIRYPKDFVPPDLPRRACGTAGKFDNACAKPFELGKSVVVKKSRRPAVAIISYGPVLTEALEAAEILKRDDIEADVLNARFAAPIDGKIIALLEKGKCLVTVEDHSLACGFGSAVLEAAAKLGKIQAPIAVLGMPGRFIKHDTRSRQFIDGGISADNIALTAKTLTASMHKKTKDK
jgi:1-deoxy-D-xylulose-5-phosphate synthase